MEDEKLETLTVTKHEIPISSRGKIVPVISNDMKDFLNNGDFEKPEIITGVGHVVNSSRPSNSNKKTRISKVGVSSNLVTPDTLV